MTTAKNTREKAMSDITRIKEIRYKDDGDWDEWPYPTIETTSRITGELRDKILKRTGRKANDTSEITIVESNVSSGWSEFTQDNDYSIDVFIGTEGITITNYDTSEESAMSRFFEWVDSQGKM